MNDKLFMPLKIITKTLRKFMDKLHRSELPVPVLDHC